MIYGKFIFIVRDCRSALPNDERLRREIITTLLIIKTKKGNALQNNCRKE
jgi:hypothetical protein